MFLFTVHHLVDSRRKFANNASKFIMLRNNRNSGYSKSFLFRNKARHERPQKFFKGRGAKSTFWLSFSLCWRCNANGRTQKMSNDTATVTYSVFPLRKFYTEKMFVLVRMDILWLSWQSSKWITNFVND